MADINNPNQQDDIYLQYKGPLNLHRTSLDNNEQIDDDRTFLYKLFKTFESRFILNYSMAIQLLIEYNKTLGVVDQLVATDKSELEVYKEWIDSLVLYRFALKDKRTVTQNQLNEIKIDMLTKQEVYGFMAQDLNTDMNLIGDGYLTSSGSNILSKLFKKSPTFVSSHEIYVNSNSIIDHSEPVSSPSSDSIETDEDLKPEHEKNNSLNTIVDTNNRENNKNIIKRRYSRKRRRLNRDNSRGRYVIQLSMFPSTAVIYDQVLGEHLASTESKTKWKVLSYNGDRHNKLVTSFLNWTNNNKRDYLRRNISIKFNPEENYVSYDDARTRIINKHTA